MEFVHEVPVAVQAPAQVVLADFSDVISLPKILTHVRATAKGDADDMARLVIVLDGHHLEFPAERTSSSKEEVCWQSLGDDVSYVLCVTVRPKTHEHCTVQVCISYDPPGFMSDLCEAFGRRHAFRHKLEDDLRTYAAAFAAPAGLQALPAAA